MVCISVAEPEKTLATRDDLRPALPNFHFFSSNPLADK